MQDSRLEAAEIGNITHFPVHRYCNIVKKWFKPVRDLFSDSNGLFSLPLLLLELDVPPISILTFSFNHIHKTTFITGGTFMLSVPQFSSCQILQALPLVTTTIENFFS